MCCKSMSSRQNRAERGVLGNEVWSQSRGERGRTSGGGGESVRKEGCGSALNGPDEGEGAAFEADGDVDAEADGGEHEED